MPTPPPSTSSRPTSCTNYADTFNYVGYCDSTVESSPSYCDVDYCPTCPMQGYCDRACNLVGLWLSSWLRALPRRDV